MLMLFRQGGASLAVQSPAFANGNYFPLRYTCDGDNISPPLKIGKLPAGAKSLVIIMEDTESPNGEFTHWVMYNVPADSAIKENNSAGLKGKNSNNSIGYFGPCPPNGIHTYYLRVYALDKMLNLTPGVDKITLRMLMKDHVLASGEMHGKYRSRRD